MVLEWGRAMDARCRVELLGRLRVQQGEREIAGLRTQKTGALLAYLAYHLERTHPREVLINILSRGSHLSAELLRLRWAAACPGCGRRTHPQGGRG